MVAVVVLVVDSVDLDHTREPDYAKFEVLGSIADCGKNVPEIRYFKTKISQISSVSGVSARLKLSNYFLNV